MKTENKRGLSVQDRIAQLKSRLDDFTEESDDETLAAVIARYDGYSDRNSLLIAVQDPDATDVSGYKEWLTRGRQVRKGEHGIAILAPAGHKEEQKDSEGNVAQKGRQFFRLTYVFDVRQTDPKPKD